MTSNNFVEHELVRRLLTKEQSSWKEFFNSYSRGLTYVCMRYIKEEEDVKDVLQNSFINMFNAIDSFTYKGSGSLKAWATRIVINESLKQLRNMQKLKITFSGDELPNVQEENEPDLVDLPEPVILEMIRALPDGYRTVFNLFVFEQKSHKEISILLNISENTSASQFHRAKKILVQKINSYKFIKSNVL